MAEQTIEFRYDTQLLIEGEDLDEDEIFDYISEHFEGDSLLAVGDEDLIKIHFHTNARKRSPRAPFFIYLFLFSIR